MKCTHPNCDNEGVNGLCSGHRSLAKDDNYWVGVCKNCGTFLRVMMKPDSKAQKYVWADKCRSCGGTKEDEEQLKKEY
jgi:DNA replicative helicase MCM subunit Mcm2 (Cdc46/Mcm family)